MKKRTLVIVFAAIASLIFSVNFGLQNKERLSDVALANIEALASGENNTGKHCFNSFTSRQADPDKPYWMWVPYCGEDCHDIRCAAAWEEGEC